MDMLAERNNILEMNIDNLNDKAFWYEDYSSINHRKYVVVAAELTGLDLQKDSLVAIGAIRMEGSRIELGKTFYRSLKPKNISMFKTLISNGKSQQDSGEDSDIEKILKEFTNFCGKDIIVGHSLFMGISFLDKAAGKIITPIIFNPMLDTGFIYEYLKENHPSLKRFLSYSGDISLSKLARRFDISSGSPNNALKTALVTAQLFQRFIHMLLNLGIKKMEDLQSIGNPFTKKSRYMVSGEI